MSNRRRISEDSLDFFDKFATIRERAERPRRGLLTVESGNQQQLHHQTIKRKPQFIILIHIDVILDDIFHLKDKTKNISWLPPHSTDGTAIEAPEITRHFTVFFV